MEPDKLRILKLLAEGPFPIVKLIYRSSKRSWKHALHDLEYEGKIKRDWNGNYVLQE